MAKQIEGVYERIIACAKQEFLDKGYTDASLRTIAANAGTSTNSIYVRFGDKTGLFAAIVDPVSQRLMEMFLEVQETFHGFDQETQFQQMGRYSADGMSRMLDYMYDHLDEFKLLLDASYGTKYHNFVDELVRVEVKYTYQYMEVMGYEAELEDEMTHNLLHLLMTAYFEGLFEVIRHGMEREEARRYVRLLGDYHHEGFKAVFYPKKGG